MIDIAGDEGRCEDVVVRSIFADEVDRFNAVLTEHHWLGRRLTARFCGVSRCSAVSGSRWLGSVRGVVMPGSG